MWPGTSGKAKKRYVRHITEKSSDQDRDFVAVNSDDEGVGLDEQGHDFVVVNYKDEGAGRDDQGRDFVVSNSKGEGAGRAKEVRRIKGGGKRASWWVKVDVGGKELDLYCNTGSNITIITPAM